MSFIPPKTTEENSGFSDYSDDSLFDGQIYEDFGKEVFNNIRTETLKADTQVYICIVDNINIDLPSVETILEFKTIQQTQEFIDELSDHLNTIRSYYSDENNYAFVLCVNQLTEIETEIIQSAGEIKIYIQELFNKLNQ